MFFVDTSRRAIVLELHRPARGTGTDSRGTSTTARSDARVNTALACGAAIMDANGTPRGADRPVQTLHGNGANDDDAESLASMNPPTVAANGDVGGEVAPLASGAAVDQVAEDGRAPLHAAAAAGPVDGGEAPVLAGGAVDGSAGVTSHPVVVALAAEEQAGVHHRVFEKTSTPSDATRYTKSSGDETLVQLGAAHKRFLVIPSTFTPGELESVLTRALTLYARCVWQAHQLLLLALRLGLLAHGTSGLVHTWQEFLFGRIYTKALIQQQQYDGRIQKAIFNSARRHWSLDHDGATFPPRNWTCWSESQISGDLTVVYLRLGLAQTTLTGAGHVVHDIVKRLFRLPHHAAYAANPTKHETVVTSLTTLGLVLAPVVVGTLLASGGSAMTAADRKAAAAAVDAFRANPTDLASARQVLRHAIDVTPGRTAAQRAQVGRIEAMLQPYKSLAALQAVLAWVVDRFGVVVAPPVPLVAA